MRGDLVSELRLAAMYANQVARAIVQMDDRLSIFLKCHVIYSQYICDQPVDRDRRIGHP